MDLLAEKYKLIEWLMTLNDESTVTKLQEIRKESLESQYPSEISEPEKLFIKAGLKDIEDGKIYSHEQVMQEVREKYGI